MARGWSLPEEFATLIEAHTDLEATAAARQSLPGPFSVALSALLPSAADADWHEQAKFEEHYAATCPNGPSLLELFQQVDDQYTEFAPVLKVSTTGRSLADHLQLEAAAV